MKKINFISFSISRYVIKSFLLTVALILSVYLLCDAQVIVKMKKDGGVYTIPAKVNGLDLEFIFDTGCSDVTISVTEAIFMLKNGYLNKSDIGESASFIVATGNVVDGTTINIRTLEIGGKKIHNIKASIVHTSSAPLLLGGSALEKFDGFSIDYAKETLILGNEEKINKSTFTTVFLLLLGII